MSVTNKLKSYYINMRSRWGLIPDLWNKFFDNLSGDYTNLKSNIDSHDINDNETYLQGKIDEIITKE